MSIMSRRGGSVVRSGARTAGGTPIPAGWTLQRLDTFGTAGSVPGPVRMHTLYYEGASWSRDSDNRVFIPQTPINSQQQTYQHFEDATWLFMSDRVRIQGRGQSDSSIKAGQLNSKFTSRSFMFEARIKVPTTLGTWTEFWAYPGLAPVDNSELDIELLMSMNGTSFNNHHASLNNHPYATPVGDDPNFSFNGTTGLLDYINAGYDFSVPHYYTIFYDDTGSGLTKRYIDGVQIYHCVFKWNSSAGGTGFGPDASLLLDLAAGSGAAGGQFPGTITSPTTWSGDMDIYSIGFYAPGSAGRAVPAGQAWGPQKTSTVTLSSGDTVATVSGSGMVGALDSIMSGTGRYYWEVVLTDGAQAGVGLALYSTDMSLAIGGDYLGRYTDQLGWYANGTVVTNNAVVATVATYTGAIRLCFALDTISWKYFLRVGPSGLWNNDILTNQNPAVGSQVGGIPVPSGIRWNVIPAAHLFTAGDVATLVAASGSWVGTPPTGFGQIGPT